MPLRLHRDLRRKDPVTSLLRRRLINQSMAGTSPALLTCAKCSTVHPRSISQSETCLSSPQQTCWVCFKHPRFLSQPITGVSVTPSSLRCSNHTNWSHFSGHITDLLPVCEINLELLLFGWSASVCTGFRSSKQI
jgi:hypothetical protein